MGRQLDTSLIRQAVDAGHASAATGQDLGAALFPRSDAQFTDRMIARGREILHRAIAEIESELSLIMVRELNLDIDLFKELGAHPKGHCYSLLQRAGLLQSEELMEHLLLLLQRGEIKARLAGKVAQDDLEAVLTTYLDHEDSNVADAAMALLVAQNREANAETGSQPAFHEMPPEIVFALAWPIAAALGELVDYEGPELAESVQRLLSRHDEGSSVPRCAHRLAQLVEELNGNYPHPSSDGADLFFARLGIRAGLPAEQIIRFCADPQMARLVVVMRALDFPVEQAVSIFGALESGRQVLTSAAYQEIDQDIGRQLLAQWGTHPLYQKARQQLAQHGPGSLPA